MTDHPSGITIAKLRAADRADWETLFRAYIDFYKRKEPLAMYERAWAEFGTEQRMHALGATVDDRLVGIVHFLVHANTSAADVCYLQDLFTAADMRGRGVARALIAAVVEWARDRGCARVYWMTQESNMVARRLYDRVAQYRGFIRYEVPLG